MTALIAFAGLLAIQESHVALFKKGALLFFFAVFAVIAIRLLLTPRSRYDGRSRLPLEDDAPPSAPSLAAPRNGDRNHE